MIAPSPWWSRDIYADRRPFLLARTRILSAIRAYFLELGFLEVETAALQVSPGNEAHLHGFQTTLIAPDGASAERYLHTSPEFACKKLLSAGEKRFFTFAHVFRNREAGPLHHPEFTMMEWYRAEEPYETLMADCAEIIKIAARAAGNDDLRFQDRTARADNTFERLSVAEAFSAYAGIDILPTLTSETVDGPALMAQACAQGIRTDPEDTWFDVFSRILVEKVEPRLGDGVPTILYGYPAVQSALARPMDKDPRLAERFEVFACGVELVNAFGELTDPVLQRRRFEEEMQVKWHVYGEDVPIDEDFLAALGDMPEASGAALGIDRLVMLATGAPRIENVLWTPVALP